MFSEELISVESIPDKFVIVEVLEEVKCGQIQQRAKEVGKKGRELFRNQCKPSLKGHHKEFELYIE